MKQDKILYETLTDLLKFNTYSGNESIMQEYVVNALRKLNFKTNVDEIGNIYAVRGKAEKYPLLNAHMDIVGGYRISYGHKYISCHSCENLFDCADLIMRDTGATRVDAFRTLREKNMAATCKGFLSYDEDFYDEEEKEFELVCDTKSNIIRGNGARIPGGDDKCGVALALQIARQVHSPMKILFTVQEEMGCVGIRHFIENNEKWFDNVKYSITIDRREGNHIIYETSSGINCTPEFCGKLVQHAVQVGILPYVTHGILADVCYIRDLVGDCVNVSAGYYNPHTEDEYIRFDEVLLIRDWLMNFVRNV